MSYYDSEGTLFIAFSAAPLTPTASDVGASTGWYAVRFAREGHNVIAIEPHTHSQVRLRENAKLNDCEDRIRLHEVAASDAAGVKTFLYNPRLPLTSGGSLEAASSVPHASKTVECVALDFLVHEHVGALKIDVEGHELSVLKGAPRIIEYDRPALVLEANTPRHVEELTAWLKDHDYNWYQADERNLLCTPQT